MGRSRLRGFTVIEMLVVLSAVAFLVGVMAPAYVRHVDRARDSALRQDLRTVRDALDQFHADRSRWPSSLQELVETKYLRALPVDPVTKSASSWVLVAADGVAQQDLQSGQAAAAGVQDVRSGAPGKDVAGVPYATY